MRDIVFVLAGVGCALAWMLVIAPLIGRTFGVPCKFAFWRIDKQNRHLNSRQHFWYLGVLTFGLGMFLFLAVSHLSNEGARLSIVSILIQLVISLGVGAI